MKRLFVVFLAFLPALALGAANWKKATTGTWSIPFGNSTSKTFTINQKAPVSALRIAYEGNYCNTVEVRYVEATYDLGITDRIYANDEGLFELDAKETLRALKIYNYQGVYTKVSCKEVLYLAEGELVDNEEFEYLGSVRYTGGKTVSKVASQVTDRITHFWVEVPSYCSKLSINKAGTITEGVFDKAHQVEKDRFVFEVNGGAGSRVSAFQLDIRGPKTLNCDLALYIRRK